MDNSSFSRLLATNDKALITELTKAPAKKKNNRPDPRKGKGKDGKGKGKGKDGDSGDEGGGKGKGKGKGKAKGFNALAPVDEKNEYRDRAKERQAGKEEYATAAAEWENQAEVTLDDSKYLGGDMDHTHLVKGLDFSLLAKVRGEQQKQQKRDEAQDARQKAKGKKRTFESLVAKQVWHTVVDTLHPHHTTFAKRMDNMSRAISLGQRIRGATSTFLPGRMNFEFDLGMEESHFDIPRIVYAAKEDAPKVDHSRLLAATMPETITKVRDSIARALEARKRRKLEKDQPAQASSHVAQKVAAAHGCSKVAHKARDSADDIFGDSGSYADTVAEMMKAAKEKAARNAKATKTEPKRSDFMDDAGASKYLEAPEGQIAPEDMVVEERAGELGSAEDDAKAKFEAADRFQGARAGWVFKVGPMGMGYYKEKAADTSADGLAASKDGRKALRSGRAARAAGEEEMVDDDAYGECFPATMMGAAGINTLEEDSDEEDGKKKLKKGEKEEEAANPGKKGVPNDPKKKRMSEDQQWEKIDTMIKKGQQRSIGELEASGSSGRRAPVPRALATPAFF